MTYLTCPKAVTACTHIQDICNITQHKPCQFLRCVNWQKLVSPNYSWLQAVISTFQGFLLQVCTQADAQRCKIGLRGILQTPDVTLHLSTQVLEETHHHSVCLSQVPDTARVALLVPTEEMVTLNPMGRDQVPLQMPYIPSLLFHNVDLIPPIWLLEEMRWVILS